jgi:hypothetical protein
MVWGVKAKPIAKANAESVTWLNYGRMTQFFGLGILKSGG